MKNQMKSKYIFACVLISFFLTGCIHYKVEEIDYSSPQKPAAILIGDPQIYSRASLINDRRQETEYLQQLLKNSAVDSSGKSFVNFNPQIIRDLKTVEALSANLGLNFGKEINNTSSSSDLNQQIEVTKLQAQLAVLQKQVEGINNASAPEVTIPSPDLTTIDLSTSQSGTSSTVTWPDVSALQHTIKDIQGQLKDLSSFNQGPTAPSNNYAALADPRDDFTDRQAYRRDIRAALAESQLDDVHDRGGNALYRLQFTATILPPSNNSRQWGATKMKIEAPKLSGMDIKSIYLNWLSYISTMLSDKGSEHGNDYDHYISKIGKQGYFNVVDIFYVSSDDKPNYYCLNHQTASDEWLDYIRKWYGVPSKKNPKNEKESQVWYDLKGTYAVPTSFLKVDQQCNQYPPPPNYVEFSKKQINEEATKIDETITISNLNKPSKVPIVGFKPPSELSMPSKLSIIKYNSDEMILFCRTIVSERKNECNNIEDESKFDAAGGSADKNNYNYAAVKSYSVLPKELVQRLGVTTESSQSLQTALAVAAQLSATTKGSLDIGYLSQAEARAEAMSRQPLVVGFAGSESDDNDRYSYFGWLFGPQFIVKEPNKLSLQQAVRNYGVNSDVCVPGWWRNFDLKVSSAWINNWSEGNHLYQSNQKNGLSVVKKRINLPMTDATYESLTNFIAGIKIGEQNSRLFPRYVVPNVVPACASSVTLQIGGANIWRANSIFFGGAKAKSISVLPDMNGVAAEFDMASVFGTLVNTDSTVQKIPLMVSAEQGSASPLYVYVVGKRQSSNGATTCQSPIFLPTTLVSLPPTVTSFSPAEICTDTKSFPLVIQGLKLPKKPENIDSNVEVKSEYFEVKSEYFTKDGDVTVNGDKTQLVVNLKRDKKRIADNLPLTPKTMPLVITFKGSQKDESLIVNIAIKDCKSAAAKTEAAKAKKAKLKTESVKKAKDQKITLIVAVPDSYAEIVISVRPHTASNDYKWTDSDSIKGVKSGSAAEVTTLMNLSAIGANVGDKLDVKVKIQPSPNKECQEINADKSLAIVASQ